MPALLLMTVLYRIMGRYGEAYAVNLYTHKRKREDGVEVRRLSKPPPLPR
jgi:hypothetical protein